MRYVCETTGKDRPNIRLSEVESSQIKAVGHDPQTNVLAIQFKHGKGAIYHYQNFSSEQHDAFMKSESLGKHFGQEIKVRPFEKFILKSEEDEEKESL